MRFQELLEVGLGGTELPARKMSNMPNPKTGQPFTRKELFLWKVMNQSPFMRKDSTEEVKIDPKEARRVKQWLDSGDKPVGIITMKTLDGGTVKNTELQKTVEFGSKEAETIPLKPATVFGTKDVNPETLKNAVAEISHYGGFPASQLYSKIANNPNIVKLGQIGDAVIMMAKQITQGQIPQAPADLSPAELKAIELYASEFLGVLAVLYGVADFPKREGFLKWVGQDLNDLMLYFPQSSSNPIADSYSLLDRKTGNALAISSKGAGKGAPPSLSGLKMPALVAKKYPEAYGFIREAQQPYSAKEQAFRLMNYLYETDPESVPRVWHKFLPWSDQDIARILESFSRAATPLNKTLMTAAKKRLSPKVAEGEATDGGKVFYAVLTDVMRSAMESVPNLREAILTSLGFNFVQIYSKFAKDGLVTRAFWPAKIDGTVTLKSKSSSQEAGDRLGYQVSD